MTLRELYAQIEGDYDQAIRVVRVEKLMDKHIRKLSDNGVVEKLLEAANGMDPVQLFEAAHAMKGVCGNLGLTRLADMASDIAEEYRPGNARKMTDEAVAAKIAEIRALYGKTTEGIRRYKEG
ncbi:MAG: Hpt domain-containing protein [Clostridia bacterium]|nr:Hpt domain-containing protein [Clostridia bacterium]